ncbi:hypothetical protein [Helicobacter burdigaliensis]|uniref:hypothetical protein n=1 Tax=Helicobacter burdigaliensis TaxID=2315334 RepID=UPI000EF6D31C|nr:hypothetical protein [Helicobacter burdigaliensis]
MQNFLLPFYYLYKFSNSLFSGVALGTIFTIYSPLPPKVYSIGGILLALCAFILTLFYTQLIKEKPYKKILVFIEIIPFLYVLAFLLFPNTFKGAILVYSLYQLSFIFGDYLVRSETLIFHQKEILANFDKLKQSGYLAGLFLAFCFYFILESLEIKDKILQVYYLHFALLLIQCFVFITLIISLNKRNKSAKSDF